MEEALILIGFVCLAVAFVWGLGARIYYAFSKKQPPRYLAVVFFSLLGVFGTGVACTEIYDIRTSSTVHTIGQLTNVSLEHGKGDHYWFTFLTDSGRYRLRTDYGGPGIQDGETVEISFLEKTSTITYLRVLDPPQHRGLVLRGGNGTGGAILLLVIGVASFTGSIALAIFNKRDANKTLS